jgi:4-aminobutyrate aminotransferase-like enzyme
MGYIVVTGGMAGDVLTLTPPLNIAEALLSAFVAALQESLAERA